MWWFAAGILLAAFLLSFLLALGICKFAPHWGLIDVPNERSSHSIPTPRGGGLAFVVSFLLGLVAFHAIGLVSHSLTAAFWGGGLLVAVVGFIDDIQPLSAGLRLIVHFLSAFWVVWVYHGMPMLLFFDAATWHWHRIGTAMGIIGFVWLINFYNFMDGIDGFAAVEAIFVALSLMILIALAGNVSLLWVLALLIAVVAAFLRFNFPPARLFMGDVGSNFLGFTFGVILVASLSQKTVMPWHWIILLGCFWVDATATLIRRVVQREPIFGTHRTFAFHIATDKLGGHRPVVLIASLINVFWLLPLSLFSVYYPSVAAWITIVAMLPVLGIWLYLNNIRKKSSQ